MSGLKIQTVEILIAGHRHKGYTLGQRDTLAGRLLGYRQRTQRPRPLLGKRAYVFPPPISPAERAMRLHIARPPR